jgi:hypothetical protein
MAKVTVPVGTPLPGATAATVPVKTTACPVTEGLGSPTTVVTVLACNTVVAAMPALPVKRASPL